MPEPRYIDLLSQIQQEAATMPGSPTSRGLPARVPGRATPTPCRQDRHSQGGGMTEITEEDWSEFWQEDQPAELIIDPDVIADYIDPESVEA